MITWHLIDVTNNKETNDGAEAPITMHLSHSRCEPQGQGQPGERHTCKSLFANHHFNRFTASKADTNNNHGHPGLPPTR